jgi:hypothetical protein
LVGGRWALGTKRHDCLVAGVGWLDWGHLLLDASPVAGAVPAAPASDSAPAAPAATPPPHADQPHGGNFWLTPGLVLRGARSGLGAALHPRESLDRARAAVELIVRDEVIAAPASSLNGTMSGTRHYASVPVDLAEVKAVKERLGGTVNDVVLAVCAGGLRHLLLSRGETPTADLRRCR